MGDHLEVGVVDGSRTTTLHLLKISAGAHISHKKDALNGLYVGACGDHVYRHCDSQIGRVAELLQEALGIFVGTVGDFGGEVISLAEHVTHGIDDFLGVVVVLGENQCLRHDRAVGENLGKETVTEGFQHEADLRLRGHRTVKV